jgi:hypothetical protein
MLPPIHVTGDPTADWIIVAIACLFCIYWLRALRLARKGAPRFPWHFTIAVVLFYGSRAVLMNAMNVSERIAFWVALFVALTVFSRKAKLKRSRHIPASVKRQVIARDMKDGKYDGSKHHLDHVWAFTSGGSHTPDNLRVTSKEKNRKKGAKHPRLWEMW